MPKAWFRSISKVARSLDIGETTLLRLVDQQKVERGGETPNAKTLKSEQRRSQEMEAKINC
ncbi:transposase [Vibrio maritimus]